MPPRFSPAATFAGLSAPVRGAIWAVISSAFFAVMGASIRLLAEYMPPLEIVFFRNLAATAFMLPWFFSYGLSTLRTGNHRLYIWRSALGLASMICWFTGVAYLPLNQSTALSFTSPLFATIFAVIMLHEVVRARRWTATIVGFIGAMIVIRPGFAEFRWEYAIILVSALLTGLNLVLMKQLTRTESPNAIVLYLTLYIMPVSLLIAIPVWVWPPLETWPIIVLLGGCGMMGHQAMTRAFAAIDASAVTALDFVRLPFVAICAWYIFGETPDAWTWGGAAIIVASAVYIAHREAALHQTAVVKPAGDPVAAVAAPAAPPPKNVRRND